VRFSQIVVGSEDLTVTGAGADGAASWRTLYETKPCLPFKEGGHAFAGLESGGRIQVLADSSILVSVGDHQFDGVTSAGAIAQSMDHDYGKTLILPMDGAPPCVFTLGHRNPQGLLVEPTGEIWVAEHGPEGGDELNLLVDGTNYGWPLQTYGTQYGELTWPLTDESVTPGPGALTPPRYSWVPSVGVTNLIAVQGDGFHRWRGDLLIGSLASRSLQRVHREGDRIVYVEPIPVDRRVRDLIETPDGRLVLWADGSLLILTVADDEPRPEEAAPE
jgi:glucose/arabinose dehydrogenase